MARQKLRACGSDPLRDTQSHVITNQRNINQRNWGLNILPRFVRGHSTGVIFEFPRCLPSTTTTDARLNAVTNSAVTVQSSTISWYVTGKHTAERNRSSVPCAATVPPSSTTYYSTCGANTAVAKNISVGCASTRQLDVITLQPTQQHTQASNSIPAVSVAGKQDLKATSPNTRRRNTVTSEMFATYDKPTFSIVYELF